VLWLPTLRKTSFKQRNLVYWNSFNAFSLFLWGKQNHHFHETNFIFYETDCKKPVASFCAALLCNMEAIHHYKCVSNKCGPDGGKKLSSFCTRQSSCIYLISTWRRSAVTVSAVIRDTGHILYQRIIFTTHMSNDFTVIQIRPVANFRPRLGLKFHSNSQMVKAVYVQKFHRISPKSVTKKKRKVEV
jgi:hypothetical protein